MGQLLFAKVECDVATYLDLSSLSIVFGGFSEFKPETKLLCRKLLFCCNCFLDKLEKGM